MSNKVETVVEAEAKAKVKVIKAKKLWKFEDGEFEIPSKVKCSKCGREVAGYAPLVYQRVYKDFGGKWLEYIKTWKCGDCKRSETDGIKSKIAQAKKEESIKKAIELLKAEGYKVEKKAEVVKATKKA